MCELSGRCFLVSCTQACNLVKTKIGGIEKQKLEISCFTAAGLGNVDK